MCPGLASLPAAKRKKARRKKLRPRPQCVMLDPRLVRHRLRTSTALTSGDAELAALPALRWKRKLAGVDDLCTARAAIRQPAPAGCGVVAHRRLAGVDDDYTARAAIRQPAPAGCWVVVHRRLAGVDDLYTARAAIRRPVCATCRRGSSTVFGPLPGSRLLPAVGGCASTCAMPQATRLAALHLHHIPHRGAHHQPCSGRSHTHLRLRQDPPPLG